MVVGLAMGSDLVAWHLAWSLDLCIPSSLTSQSELLGICCSWSVSGLCYPSKIREPYLFSRDNRNISACLITGSNYRRDHVLKEDAKALKTHHKSLEEYVQLLETMSFDVDQPSSTTFSPEELHIDGIAT